jgi:hypothetical protein
VQRMRAAGADQFVVKPLMPGQLSDLLDRLTDSSRST